MSFVETAHAKLNLALHVRARAPDGYHRIESIFAFCADGDVLHAAPAENLTLAINGPFAEGLSAGEDNLVLRAACALRARCGIAAGAALTLDKRLPVASGIGGGSADAGAALRLLARLWGIDRKAPLLAEIARGLGADVPACLLSQTVRGDGRGDRLAPLPGDALAGLPALLVNPRIAISTAEIFRIWDGRDRGSLPEGDPLDAARAGRNDLEAPAIARAPVIAALVAWLGARPGALLARMSGSGATCFALFARGADRDAAVSALGLDHPGFWYLATRLM